LIDELVEDSGIPFDGEVLDDEDGEESELVGFENDYSVLE